MTDNNARIVFLADEVRRMETEVREAQGRVNELQYLLEEAQDDLQSVEIALQCQRDALYQEVAPILGIVEEAVEVVEEENDDDYEAPQRTGGYGGTRRY